MSKSAFGVFEGKINKSDLAEFLGLSKQAVHNWKCIPNKYLQKTARWLHTSPSLLRPDLYGEEKLINLQEAVIEEGRVKICWFAHGRSAKEAVDKARGSGREDLAEAIEALGLPVKAGQYFLAGHIMLVEDVTY